MRTNHHFLFFFIAILFFFSCDDIKKKKAIPIENKVEVKISKRDTTKLCFCVFDHFMPLSEKKPDSINNKSGLYVDLGKFIAKNLNETPDFYFLKDYYFMRPLRKGILADNCDIQFGFPDNGRPYIRKGKILASKPYINFGYVVVVPKGKKIKSVSDLKKLKFSLLSGSPPQTFLLKNGNSITPVYEDGDAMKLLEKGDVDACFIWGPTAGYLNKYTYHNAYDIYKTPYNWKVVMGITAKNKSLANSIENIHSKITHHTDSLKTLYGINFKQKIDIPNILLN